MESEEVRKIREQYLSGLWPKFLEMISIDGLRGWSGQSINFNFPIVAIVGENGIGKSTILKTAACAYNNDVGARTFYPSNFFMVTLWDKVQNVRLNYRIKQGDQVHSFRISKHTKKWGYPEKQYRRKVYIFDIARTLPLDATVGYAKIAKQAVSEVSSLEL